MSDYKFSFGYLALKMLGKTLYSNPFAALSELIANGFDAKADKVWVSIDIREKSKSKIVIIDNGKGMTDDDVIQKYLQVGKKNRAENDNEMMGRKGIGKLAAFYLSNKYYLLTKTSTEENMYEIDFTMHEKGIKAEEDDTYMTKISSCDFDEKEIYNKLSKGTALFLTDVNFTGYGEKTFAVLEAELAELFSLKDKYVYLKIVNTDEDLEKEFIVVRKRIAYKNMSKIFYNEQYSDSSKLLSLSGTEIINADKESNETKIYVDVSKVEKGPRDSIVEGKVVKINPVGWIGIHQTINRAKAHSNDPENFIDSKFYHFNKVRVYVRGKLALENILPYVHNTQYYVNYIEGEIHCDELDDNKFPDIASSSRQDIDKNDDRFIALVEYVKEIVNALVKFKNDQTNKDLASKKKKQISAVHTLSTDVKETLSKKIGKKVENVDIEEISHSIINSFEKVQDVVKTDYVVFLSHKREDKKLSDFIYNFLTCVCRFDEASVFYTSKSGGQDESVEVLEKQINETLTSKNTYVVFCIESGKFKDSEYCMFEGGAAWAVKQKDVIGLVYNDYDKYVPAYLKNMKKIKINFANPNLDRDLYVSIIKLLNSLISYLNRNFSEEKDKRPLFNETLPTEVDLDSRGENLEKYFDINIVKYWNYYVLK